jgi:hypothetical protein
VGLLVVGLRKRKATVRHPRHKDWTTRKIDILYDQSEVNKWMELVPCVP